MNRSIAKFALFPKRLSNGEWVWLNLYVSHQEYKDVYVCIRDLGYPNMGEWGWEKEWVTVKTDHYNVQT